MENQDITYKTIEKQEKRSIDNNIEKQEKQNRPKIKKKFTRPKPNRNKKRKGRKLNEER